MIPTKKALGLQNSLLAWFDQYGRHDLPWQHPKSPYRVWLSEIMLQQTQVKTVIPYFQKFMTTFPNLQALAAADLSTVLQHWAGLGYYARARNLHRSAHILVKDYGGDFPQSTEALVTLPGIGKSTAHAILSTVWQQPLAILDGNVKRVLSRLEAIDQPINTTSTEKWLWQLAQSLVPNDRPGDYTQAMMDLGATCCTRRQPNCGACPWRTACKAYQHHHPHDFPKKLPKAPIKSHDVTFYVITHNNHVLLQKRPSKGLWGGLWSLPGSLDRTCAPPLMPPPKAHPVIPLRAFQHAFTHFRLTITAVSCETWQTLSEDGSMQWTEAHRLKDLGFPKPIATILKAWQEAKQSTAVQNQDATAMGNSELMAI